MTAPELAAWLRAVSGLTSLLHDTARGCPHCRRRDYDGCAACNVLYHAARLLESHASLLRQVGAAGIPQEIKE